jgi:single-strand DNA-binding protein
MADTHVTLTGNLTDDPDLRYTPNGTQVANFRLAVTARIKDGEGWRDGETSFFRVNVWRQLAEHVAESPTKGDRAVVIGRLKSRSWETPEGDKWSVVEVEADEVAPSLRWATAKPEHAANGKTKGGEFNNEGPVLGARHRHGPGGCLTTPGPATTRSHPWPAPSIPSPPRWSSAGAASTSPSPTSSSTPTAGRPPTAAAAMRSWRAGPKTRPSTGPPGPAARSGSRSPHETRTIHRPQAHRPHRHPGAVGPRLAQPRDGRAGRGVTGARRL